MSRRRDSAIISTYRHAKANPDCPKNMLLIKNPQFLSNHYKTWSKSGINENLILTKFRNYWVKIVDFLSIAHFWVSPDLPLHACINFSKIKKK